MIQRHAWRRLASVLVMAAVAAGVGWLAESMTSRPVPRPARSHWSVGFVGANLVAVSCASPTYCLGALSLGGSSYFTTYNGRGWISPPHSLTVGSLISVDCPAPGWCAALTEADAVTNFSAGRWSDPVRLNDPARFDPGFSGRVSCPAVGSCVIVQTDGLAAIDQGGRFGALIQIDPSFPLEGISCGRVGQCLAIDGGGRVLWLRGNSWSSPERVDDDGLTAVSCARNYCAVADLAGRVLVGTGQHLSTPFPIVTLASDAVALSCPQVGTCLAVSGSSERALIGGRWEKARVIDPSIPGSMISPQLSAVSCASGSSLFCAAVDIGGNLLDGDNPFAGR